MKMMICGDIHFGLRNNSNKHLDFQTKWFREELIPLLKENNCESIVFLGDVFDSRNTLSPLVLRRVRKLFKELMSVVSNAYCIVGNHDLYFRNNKSVHSLDVLTDQGITVFEKPTQLKINEKKILFIPWIVKDEIDDVTKLLVENDFDICFGHLEINGFEQVKGIVEKEGLKQELFANCKKVYSGHFHLRCNIDHINYVGTPYEINWNDYQDKKGVHILDVNCLKDTFVTSKNSPKHIKIPSHKYNIDNLNKKLVTNNIVKIIYDSNISEVDKINFNEKINSLEPLMVSIDDEEIGEFDTNENIEADIKNTMGFLVDYLNVIEIPEELNKKILIEKLEEIHKQCV